MYNLYTKQRRDAEAAARAAVPEANVVRTPQQRERLAMSVYGKSRAQLAMAHEDRVEEFDTHVVETGLQVPPPAKNPNAHWCVRLLLAAKDALFYHGPAFGGFASSACFMFARGKTLGRAIAEACPAIA